METDKKHLVWYLAEELMMEKRKERGEWKYGMGFSKYFQNREEWIPNSVA